MKKQCQNCSFYKVADVDCLYHYDLEVDPENCCDNHESKEGNRIDLATHIAESVVGSCDSSTYRDITETFNDAEWGAFEEITFECGRCGWWCETGDEEDYHGERFCSDCYSDQIEEDEEND